jgi:glycosyltransferase involved in cell wall biosynthesis
MRICHISTVHKAFDGRIFHKECTSLAKAGFDVSWVVSHDKNEIKNGVHIVPLKVRTGRLKRIVFGTTEAFFKALKTKSKLYHFHDPELLFVGFLLKILGKQVIYDMHELVYYQIENKQWLGSKGVSKLISKVYRVFEAVAVRWFDAIIIAEDGYQEYFDRVYPKYLNKVIPIRNYPILSLNKNSEEESPSNDIKKVIYVGGISKIRGIEEIIKAVEKLDGLVQLDLVGAWEDDRLKEKCLNGTQFVNYIGVVPLTEIYTHLKTADIGLAILYPDKNYLNSLPTKAFEYMDCSLPFIMSNFPYWQDVFAKNALFVDPYSVDEIADKIAWLIENPEKALEMGKTNRKEVRSKFNWDKEAETLVQAYNDIFLQ